MCATISWCSYCRWLYLTVILDIIVDETICHRSGSLVEEGNLIAKGQIEFCISGRVSVIFASVLDTLPSVGDGNWQTSLSDRQKEGKFLRLFCSASRMFCRQRQMIKIKARNQLTFRVNLIWSIFNANAPGGGIKDQLTSMKVVVIWQGHWKDA